MHTLTLAPIHKHNRIDHKLVEAITDGMAMAVPVFVSHHVLRCSLQEVYMTKVYSHTTQTVTMKTQVLLGITTRHTPLSTQFTQCIGSQTMGQEKVHKILPQSI